MSRQTIADEARDIYDLATLLTLDVVAQFVVNGNVDAMTVSRAVNIRGVAKKLLEDISGSRIGAIELPERQIDVTGCGSVIDAMLADKGSVLSKSMRLANLDGIRDVLDEVGASPEFYKVLADMRREAEAS